MYVEICVDSLSLTSSLDMNYLYEKGTGIKRPVIYTTFFSINDV